MHVERLHGFAVTTHEAIGIQQDLAPRVVTRNSLKDVRHVLGLDVSVERNGEATAAAVTVTYPGLQIAEKVVLKDKVEFPYVPGLLSFREIPISLRVCEKLVIGPDLVMVDGQGRAHPRRIGLASHLGLFLGIPTIGCAKSRLCGDCVEPAEFPGSRNELKDNMEVIGTVLRTRSGSKPLFISVGHMIDLSAAVDWVLKCCLGYRLPEPTRLAHLASKGQV